MKKIIPLFLLFSLLCRNNPESVPLGTWNYTLLMNGVEIGRAVMSNRISDNNYVSTTEMEINSGGFRNFSKQIITETMNFIPVKAESHNKTVNGGVHEASVIAEFSGNEVAVERNGIKIRITLKKPFFLDGGFFLSELVKKKFAVGAEIKTFIYEPSMEIEEPIPVRVKVLGRSGVTVNGKNRSLLHVIESMENHKFVDSYLDDKGVPQKITIAMLNSRIELVIQE